MQLSIDKNLSQIESIRRLILNLEKQRSELESQIKIISDSFVKTFKEDISNLIDIESKQSTEKNIYEKTEEERLNDKKSKLNSKSIRYKETEKEYLKKIDGVNSKLREIEEESNLNAKEYVDERDQLVEEISQVDKEILELQRQLKLKLEHKQSLEKQHTTVVNAIKQVNQEFESEIDDLNETKAKYQKKMDKNTEKLNDLEEEIQHLAEQEEHMKQQISEFETQIDGFVELTSDMKCKIKKQERHLTKLHKTVQEFDSKWTEFRELVESINKWNSELKKNESMINNLDDSLDDYWSKLNELERTLESLEEEKKTFAQQKKFKDAKRVKDTIEYKTEQKSEISEKIAQLKSKKQEVEDSIETASHTLQNLAKKKEKQELEIRNFEYDLLWLKRKELKYSLRDPSEEYKESDVMKILTKEIVELEDKFGFWEKSDSGDESKLSNDQNINKNKPVSSDIESDKSEPEVESTYEPPTFDQPIDSHEEDSSPQDEIPLPEYSEKSKEELAKQLEEFESLIEQAAANDDFEEADRLAALQEQVKAQYDRAEE